MFKKKRDTTVTDAIRLRMSSQGRGDQGGRKPQDDYELDFRTLLLAPDPTREIAKSYTDFIAVGQGAFGSVWKCTNTKTGDKFAVKQVPKSKVQADMEYVFAELEAMVKLDHPNVVKFYEFFEEPETLMLVTELCDGGDFSDLGHDIDDIAEIQRLFRDMVAAVAYCHDHGVAHRDLKFENCLISKTPGQRRVAKVIDFGLSAIRQPGEKSSWLHDQLGTRYFVAPEIIDERINYGVKCDCWSMGVMLYIILTDEHPCAKHASRLETNQLFRKIMFAEVRLGPLEDAGLKDGDHARDLCLKFLRKKPDLRISSEDALKHQWLTTKNKSSWQSKTIAGRGPDKMEIPTNPSMMNGELLDRIGSFGESARFEKAVLTLVAHQTHCNEVEDLRSCFMDLDESQTGSLSPDEIKQGLTNAGVVMTDQQVLQIFKSLDLDKSGKVHYTEWLAATMKPSIVASERAIRAVFDFLDIEGNGKVSMQELCQVLGSGQAAEQMIEDNDVAGDGCLSWEEFQTFMLKMSRKMEVTSKHSFNTAVRAELAKQ